MNGAPAARLLLASRVAILVLATVSSYFVLHTLSVMWSPNYGGFGIDMDGDTLILEGLAPRYASSGIHVGDRVELATMPFRERGYLYENTTQPAGEQVTVRATRAGSTHTATIQSVAFHHGVDDGVAAFGRKIVAMAYILVAVVLVWTRPNLMLWGLAVFLIRMHPYFIDHLETPPLAALVIFSYSFVYALGWPGLMVFAARFPDNRTDGATKYWDLAAAALFFLYMYLGIHDFIPLFTARPIGDVPDWLSNIPTLICELAVLVALCWKLLRPRGRSQWDGFRWVVAGYAVSIVLGWTVLGYVFDYVPFSSSWPIVGQQLLMLALPASVAYAIIRHRAFGLGYVANRTLAYGAFVVCALSTIVIGVWLASQVTSAIGIALALFGALLAGMALQAYRRSVARFVDRVFLPRRYEAAVSLDRIRDSLRTSNDPARLTDELAAALGLTSLAVFSRAPDGGFVRKAAVGWPPGSAWHLLPDEALTRSLNDGGTIAPLPDELDDDIALPAADARPRFALALKHGDRVDGAILVGPQRSGSSLDRDAMRSLRGVYAEALAA